MDSIEDEHGSESSIIYIDAQQAESSIEPNLLAHLINGDLQLIQTSEPNFQALYPIQTEDGSLAYMAISIPNTDDHGYKVQEASPPETINIETSGVNVVHDDGQDAVYSGRHLIDNLPDSAIDLQAGEGDSPPTSENLDESRIDYNNAIRIELVEATEHEALQDQRTSPIQDLNATDPQGGSDSIMAVTPLDEGLEKGPVTEPPKPRPDFSKPIPLTEETIVVVEGKKCFLRSDPITGELCAFPATKDPTPGRRGRGRPRKGDKVTPTTKPVTPQPTPPDDVWRVETAGPDGARRSGRARKKASILTDYELGKPDSEGPDSSEDEGAVDGDAAVRLIRKSRGRPPKTTTKTGTKSSAFISVLGHEVKRGRGRPKRSGKPERRLSPDLNGPIPALIIQNADGQQTIMLAPGQTLEYLQQRKLAIAPSLTIDDVYGKTPVIIQSDDAQDSDNAARCIELVDGRNFTRTVGGSAIAREWSDEENSGVEYAVIGESDTVDEQLSKAATASESRTDVTEMKRDSSSSQVPPTVHAAMVTVSQALMSNLSRGANVKIGLKTTEHDLEKLKCSRCNYQAYYEQHYHQHLINMHSAEIDRCKCCEFATLEKEDLIKHFKSKHPRNYCHFCDLTSDRAYIIKRHMMRHTADGCVCAFCGKVYKDQYIMKMHVKMVHMPADVLFECSVCGKKFTRKSHLKRHLRTHDLEKPHKCLHCEYRGVEKADVAKHMLVHDAPKLTCELCGKTFRHAKNKNLHLKRHNKQRDYKCGICNFYGYTFTDIRKHIERIHAENHEAFYCQRCEAVFETATEFATHHTNGKCEVGMFQKELANAEDGVNEEDIVDEQAALEDGTVLEQVTSRLGPRHVTTRISLAEITEGRSDGSRLSLSGGHQMSDTDHANVHTSADLAHTEMEFSEMLRGSDDHAMTENGESQHLTLVNDGAGHLVRIISTMDNSVDDDVTHEGVAEHLVIQGNIDMENDHAQAFYSNIIS